MAYVLLIDDDRQLRAMLRQALSEDGHEVREAADGVQGTQAFRERPADLVILDLFMPRQGGWATLRALQALAPGLPFVIMSGGGALEGLRRGASSTLDCAGRLAPYRVLRKPFRLAALAEAIDDLLPAPHLAQVDGP